MPKALNKLSARFVETIKEPGRYGDGGNLHLFVGKGGSKSWIMIYRFGPKQREIGLGSFEKVSLKVARQLASDARELLGAGVDPLEHRAEQSRRAAAIAAAEAAETAKATFGAFALGLLNGYVERDAKGKARKIPGLLDGLRNEKHKAQWETTLRDYAQPIWSMKVEAIGTEDVLRCVAPIWTTKNETARRVRGRIETVLTAAIAKKLRPAPNPATLKGNLEALLPKVRKLQRGHHPALPWREVPALWTKLTALESVSARALAFTILTAARSGEVRGASWAEIDVEEGLWTVPAPRMKAGREHTVPLSQQSLDILTEVAALRRTGLPSELLFPSVRDRKPLSDMALSMCLRGLRPGVTTHGFRSSFRDWCGDATSFSRELAEQALAHTVGGVEGAYRRGDALEKRRAMMKAWAEYITGVESSNVVNIASFVGK